MRGGDARSRRVALVADAVVNGDDSAALDALVAAGWGIVQLPPAALPDGAARAWIADAVDQLRELHRHGHRLAAVLDGEPPARRAMLEAELAGPPALEVPALAAGGSAER